MVNKLLKSKKGFTLVEIIVVLVIMGILLAIAVPAILGYVKKAEEAKFMAAIRSVNTEAITYAEEYMIKNPDMDFQLSTAQNPTGKPTIVSHLQTVFLLKGNKDKEFTEYLKSIELPDGFVLNRIDLEFDHQVAIDDRGGLTIGWGYDKTASKHSVTKVSTFITKGVSGQPGYKEKYIVTLLNKQMYIYNLESTADAEKIMDAISKKLEEAPVITSGGS